MTFDYFVALNWPIEIMKYFGMWQMKESRLSYRMLRFLLHTIFISLPAILHTVYTVNTLSSGTIIELSEDLRMLGTLYSVLLKSLWYLHKFQDISGVLESAKALVVVSSCSEKDRRPLLESSANRIDKVKKIYFTGVLVATISSELASIYKFVLPYNSWYYFNYKESFQMYGAAFIYQSLATHFGSMLLFSCDMIPLVCMNMASTLLEELSMQIESIHVRVNDESAKPIETDRRLRDCIECHIKINDFAKEISSQLSVLALVQAFLSAVILCTSAFSLTFVILLKSNQNLKKVFIFF